MVRINNWPAKYYWGLFSLQNVNKMLTALITLLTFQSVVPKSICIQKVEARPVCLKTVSLSAPPSIKLHFLFHYWRSISARWEDGLVCLAVPLGPMAAHRWDCSLWEVDIRGSMSDVLTVVGCWVLHHSLSSEAVRIGSATVHQMVQGKSIYTWPSARNGRNKSLVAGAYTNTHTHAHM